MDRNTSIFLAIILSLTIHAGVLMVLLFQGTPLTGKPGPEEVEVEVVEIDQEVLQALSEMPAVSSDLMNLVANRNQERTSDPVTSQSSRSVNAENVESDLRDFESETFRELEEARASDEDPDAPGEEHSEIQEEPSDRYDWYKENNPEGNVAAEYDLMDRNGEYMPKPAYVCEYSGVIVLDIQVGQDGRVEEATVNTSKSNTNQYCLTSSSVRYAKKWKFNASSSAPKKQNGTITFTFVRQ